MAVALPSSLVTPAWLNSHLGQVNLLDATFAMPGSGKHAGVDYALQHIPGAQFFNIEEIADPDSEWPHMLPVADEFASALVTLGFDENRSTVIYDDGSTMGACRCWWMLRVFGYDSAALLDGGLPAWEKAGHAVTDAVTPECAGAFTPNFRTELVWDKRQVLENMQRGDTVLLDARSPQRFKGEAAEPRPGLRRGHIPGALNVHYATLLDTETKCFKTPDALREVISQAGIHESEPLAATCGSGISACVIAFALHLLGRSDVPVYDGSWAEWGASAGNPIMQGPAQRLQPPRD